MAVVAAAAKLNELMTKRGITPKWELVDEESVNGTHMNTFVMRVICPTVCNGPKYVAEGTGRSKKEAKHAAAFNFMQKYLGFKNQSVNQNNAPSVEVQPTVKNSSFTCAVNVTDCNRHVVLQGLCLKYNWGRPEFREVDVSGPPHSRHFTARCSVGNFIADGKGTTKSEAKLNATTNMIKTLMQEAEVSEIFESPQLTITSDSKEMICLSENLKRSGQPKPFRIFGRRNSNSSSFDNYPAKSSSVSSAGLPGSRGNINTPRMTMGSGNNREKVDNIAENSDDSTSNTSLIDFDDISPHRLGNGKHKSKSLNNLSKLDRDFFCEKTVMKIETTFENVEKQLYNEILDSLGNRELPRQKNVLFLSHEFEVFITHESRAKIFEGNRECTDPSIRIACLTQLLMDLQSHVQSSRRNSNQ